MSEKKNDEQQAQEGAWRRECADGVSHMVLTESGRKIATCPRKSDAEQIVAAHNAQPATNAGGAALAEIVEQCARMACPLTPGDARPSSCERYSLDQRCGVCKARAALRAASKASA